MGCADLGLLWDRMGDCTESTEILKIELVHAIDLCIVTG